MKKWGIFLGIVVSFTLATYLYAQDITPSSLLTVSFLDVGQGDAIYIRTPNGTDVLVDGGPDDSVIYQLGTVMPFFDKSIDLVVATHPDKDHIAGLIPVFENYTIHAFMRSEISSGTSFDITLNERTASEAAVTMITARRGQRIVLDDTYGIYLDVLFPDQDTSSFSEPNDASIVLKLVYGDSSFLLTGDISIPVEQFLSRRDPLFLETDVLKLGHHGSRTSSSDEFLDHVQPDYAIVSAGKNNSYGHPHTQVIERLRVRTIPVLSTQTHGTITFITDGITLWTK